MQLKPKSDLRTQFVGILGMAVALGMISLTAIMAWLRGNAFEAALHSLVSVVFIFVIVLLARRILKRIA
jgi:hypothetical protein